MIVLALRSRFAVAGLACLAGMLIVASPLPAGPGDSVEGQGAAGVTEVGRPLDVVRGRAEIQARERAVDALVLSANLLAAGKEPSHRLGQQTGVPDEEIRVRATGKTAVWHLRYWSNGAVTARVTLPREVAGNE